MSQNILFVGMDVHKESVEIALAEGASRGRQPGDPSLWQDWWHAGSDAQSTT